MEVSARWALIDVCPRQRERHSFLIRLIRSLVFARRLTHLPCPPMDLCRRREGSLTLAWNGRSRFPTMPPAKDNAALVSSDRVAQCVHALLPPPSALRAGRGG